MTMSSCTLTIASVAEPLFHGEVTSVTAPGAVGELTILKGHLPLVTPLVKGIIKIKGEEEKSFPIERGILEVSKGEVVILV
jgi:F-type H+-transporting ATPase subunit epsilon